MMEVSVRRSASGSRYSALPLAVSGRHYGAGGSYLRYYAIRGSGRGTADPLAFSIAKKTNTSLKLAIPLCTALMAVHCVYSPHPAALFVTNKLGADVGTVIVYGLLVGLVASLWLVAAVPETARQPSAV